TPTQVFNPTVRLLPRTVIYQAVGVERTVESLIHFSDFSDLQHDFFGSVPSVHQCRLVWQHTMLAHVQHLTHMVQLALTITVWIEDAIVNYPELLTTRVDIHARHDTDASDHTFLVAAPLATRHLNMRSKAVVQ